MFYFGFSSFFIVIISIQLRSNYLHFRILFILRLLILFRLLTLWPRFQSFWHYLFNHEVYDVARLMLVAFFSELKTKSLVKAHRTSVISVNFGAEQFNLLPLHLCFEMRVEFASDLHILVVLIHHDSVHVHPVRVSLLCVEFVIFRVVIWTRPYRQVKCHNLALILHDEGMVGDSEQVQKLFGRNFTYSLDVLVV